MIYRDQELLLFIGLTVLIQCPLSFALDRLPYTTRTRSYSAWSTAARGDIRTVGMAGATLGLADTFIASIDNPAGLAMTLNGGDTNFASDVIYDANIQNYNSAIYTYAFGAALNTYPWGFSMGYVSPFEEGQQYSLTQAPNDPVNLKNTAREAHLSFAHIFFHDRLSLGLSLILSQAENQIEVPTKNMSEAFHSYSIGATVGSTIQLKHRLLLGLSYSLPMHYAVDSENNPNSGVTHFFQSIDVPSRFGIGLGWIPNRFFRADLTTLLVGRTDNTALLRDNEIQVGEYVTLQPKIGIAYTMFDYKELKGTLFLGSYYEVTRIAGTSDRLHGTIGMEFKPWILSVGWGLDSSYNYKNYLGSIGIDVFKVMEKLEIIPAMWRPPYAGPFPKPTYFSDEGLARPLVKNWVQQGPALDPFKIGLAIPGKIEEKALQFEKSLEEEASEITNDVIDSVSDTKKSTPTSPPKPENKQNK